MITVQQYVERCIPRWVHCDHCAKEFDSDKAWISGYGTGPCEGHGMPMYLFCSRECFEDWENKNV